jgi:uncharacterized protein YegL
MRSGSLRRHLRLPFLPDASSAEHGDCVFSKPQQLISCLVDNSGSMWGTPIEQVNSGLRDCARDCSQYPVPPGTVQFQLVTFGGDVKVCPFVPVAQFVPPTLAADGLTPMAEAILAAMSGTQRYVEFLRNTAEVEVVKPLYFLLSDGRPSSPPSLLQEAAAAIAQQERNRQAAFYAFGVDQDSADALQPLFQREVQLISKADFGAFFRALSVSVRRVSCQCVSEDVDLLPVIKTTLRIPYAGNNDA